MIRFSSYTAVFLLCIMLIRCYYYIARLLSPCVHVRICVFVCLPGLPVPLVPITFCIEQQGCDSRFVGVQHLVHRNSERAMCYSASPMCLNRRFAAAALGSF